MGALLPDDLRPQVHVFSSRLQTGQFRFSFSFAILGKDDIRIFLRFYRRFDTEKQMDEDYDYEEIVHLMLFVLIR